MYADNDGTTHIRLPHAALLCAMQQSIHISCRLGPQQQKQTDGTQEMDRSCSAYYAGSTNKTDMLVTATSPSAKAKRYQNMILGTSTSLQ